MKHQKFKKLVTVLLLLVIGTTLLCGSALAGTTYGKTAFTRAGVYTPYVTRADAACWGQNSVSGSSSTIVLYAASANINNSVHRTITVTGTVAQRSSLFSNPPYTCTFYAQVQSTNTTGHIALWY